LAILAAMRETDSVDPHWAMAMQAIEQRGDQLTSSIIRKAEQTFITPLDREDILALAVAVDDVLDFIEEFTIKPTLSRCSERKTRLSSAECLAASMSFRGGVDQWNKFASSVSIIWA
jgi:uncharacterized protein Yka (UPF0111/DUF47 family)